MHAIQVVHGLARGPSLPFPAHQKREVAWKLGWYRLRGDGPSGKISPAPAPMRLRVGFDACGGSREKAGQRA